MSALTTHRGLSRHQASAPRRRQSATPLRIVPASGEPDLNEAPPGRWVDIGRRGRIWVREHPGPEGAPTLLLLHGLGATGGLNWAGIQHFLGDRYRLLTIDHRGHGRGIRTRNFRLEDCADDAAAAIEALGLERPIVVGYSMGGPVAALLWRRHRHLVGGLVFCATSRNFRGSPGEKLAFGAFGLTGLAPVALPTGLMRRVSSAVCALPHPGPVRDLQFAVDELAGHDPRSVVQAAGAIGRFNASPWIDQIDVPTSVVVTTHDQVVPPIRQLRLARSIPGATLHCVPVGHFCVAGGDPKRALFTEVGRACDDVVAARSGAGQVVPAARLGAEA